MNRRTLHSFCYMYILQSLRVTDQIYIGSTNDLKKRFKEHNENKVISTKRYSPWNLFYYEAFSQETFARLRESRLKNNGNALIELKKRVGLTTDSNRASPLTTFASKSGKGFTLIELLVVTGVIIVVSGVVLANQNKFGGQVLLQNFAYDVALSIRQAQVYGLAVARAGSGGTAAFGTSYGIHFDINTPKVYYLFADLNKNGIYDSTPVDEGGEGYGQTMNIRRGFVISDLCISSSGGAAVCSNKKTDVVFQRPEPDAKISWTDGESGLHSCFSSNPQCADSATITLRSPRGDTMSVVVDYNGQISVSKP